ncbi:RNase H domain-containing protein [Trichonephila clavipes]|nr:RNase H domain-containing protein [Trichonephila clavipes]
MTKPLVYTHTHSTISLSFPCDRQSNICLFRLVSRHLKRLTFSGGNKRFPICCECQLGQASPQHIFNCLELGWGVIHGSPLLVSDFVGHNRATQKRLPGRRLNITGLDVRLSLAIALSSIQVTLRFLARFHPNFEREHPRGAGASRLSSPSTYLTRGFTARWLFRVPPFREGTIPLRTFMPSVGFESRSYGTAVSVANHYNGWATCIL